MKKTLLLLLAQCVVGYGAFAQAPKKPVRIQPKEVPARQKAIVAETCSINDYKSKSFIFDENIQLVDCDAVGDNESATPTTILIGSVFKVVHVDAETCDLVIQLNEWTGKDAAGQTKRATYNYNNASTRVATLITPNDNIKYFKISKSAMTASSSEYANNNWDISIGAFILPFKFRPTKSQFTSNLSLGSSVYFKVKTVGNHSFGAVVGLSLSAVTLDSLSTNGFVRTGSDRPAITPSLSLLYSYKNINLTFGSGVDLINKTSDAEKAWIYHGKPWLGFGIGISLFSPSTTPATPQTEGQH